MYGPTYAVVGNRHQFEVHVPIWSDDTAPGVIVGVYSLSDLVVRELPWWFSERYRVAVFDSDGREIAAKSKVAPVSSQLAYSMPFDPPGHGLTLQITAYKSDTRWIPVLLGASIVLLAGIIVWSVMQLRRQLARRQQAEIALRAESAFRKAMEDSMLTGMRARDLDGRLTYVNAAFCHMTGFTAEELLGLKAPMPYWDPERLAQTFELHRQILSNGSATEGTEVRLRRKNGETLDVLVFEAPLIDARGQHAGWMGSVLDITEQKRAREQARQQEERLQQSSRLITMGEMASTLAHELNQPLSAIANYCAGCIKRMNAGNYRFEDLLSAMQKASDQADRAGKIIRRMRDMVKKSDPNRAPVTLAELIDEARAFADIEARRTGAQIAVDLPENLPRIDVDRIMIEQVLLNLVKNGIEAMHDTPFERRCLEISARQLDARWLEVDIADHGHGLPEEDVERIFAPFYTTKLEGMGIGLPICRSIIEFHQGRLWVERRPEGGTIFRFTVPIEEEEDADE